MAPTPLPITIGGAPNSLIRTQGQLQSLTRRQILLDTLVTQTTSPSNLRHSKRSQIHPPWLKDEPLCLTQSHRGSLAAQVLIKVSRMTMSTGAVRDLSSESRKSKCHRQRRRQLWGTRTGIRLSTYPYKDLAFSKVAWNLQQPPSKYSKRSHSRVSRTPDSSKSPLWSNIATRPKASRSLPRETSPSRSKSSRGLLLLPWTSSPATCCRATITLQGQSIIRAIHRRWWWRPRQLWADSEPIQAWTTTEVDKAITELIVQSRWLPKDKRPSHRSSSKT